MVLIIAYAAGYHGNTRKNAERAAKYGNYTNGANVQSPGWTKEQSASLFAMAAGAALLVVSFTFWLLLYHWVKRKREQMQQRAEADTPPGWQHHNCQPPLQSVDTDGIPIHHFKVSGEVSAELSVTPDTVSLSGSQVDLIVNRKLSTITDTFTSSSPPPEELVYDNAAFQDDGDVAFSSTGDADEDDRFTKHIDT